MEIFAVKPPRGRIVHLHSPGYSLTPLAIALRWTSLLPSDADPRPTWMWCKLCMGHVVAVHGMQHEVLAAVAKRGDGT
jgi:hypothetical protein